jgi:hypothetical protein
MREASLPYAAFYYDKKSDSIASLMMAATFFHKIRVQRALMHVKSWKIWQNGTNLFILSVIISG